MARRRIDLTGNIYGSLIALRDVNKSNHNRTRIWECHCIACGAFTEKPSTKLRSGEVKSCGCQEHIRPVRSQPGHSGANASYVSYRGGARQRKLEFSLSFEEYKQLVVQPCFYCGVKDSKVCYGSTGAALSHGEFRCNGLDRVDNELGYHTDNVVPCCTQCNIAKGKSSVTEFKNWINRAHAHLNTKG